MGGKVEYREVDISTDQAAMFKYGVQSTPSVIVLDRSGRTLDFFVGVPDRSELESSLEKAASQ
jgi:thioredoxin-like negative regulator of GroEL